MADVKQPQSVPCQFEEAYVGKCKRPSTNGWCGKHESLVCISCGQKAVKTCEYTCGPMCCCQPLCTTCIHAFDGKGHSIRKVYDQKALEARQEKKAMENARTSKDRRLNKKTGLPLNTLELLKGDFEGEGYKLRPCFYLFLESGHFFPAVFRDERDGEKNQMIFTVDKELILYLWKLLPPRRSDVDSQLGYVNASTKIMYPYSEDEDRLEVLTPQRYLDRTEFEMLNNKPGKHFGWARGMISNEMDPEEFKETIKQVSEMFT